MPNLYSARLRGKFFVLLLGAATAGSSSALEQELLVRVQFGKPHPPYIAAFYNKASVRSRGNVVEAAFIFQYENNFESAGPVAADCSKRLVSMFGVGLVGRRDSDEVLSAPKAFEKPSLEEDVFRALCPGD